MKNRIHFLLITLLSFVSFLGNAQIGCFDNCSLDQQQEQIDYGFGLNNIYDRWQEFIPEDFVFTGAALLIDKNGTSGGDITFQLQAQNGDVLAEKILLENEVPIGQNWVCFLLDQPYQFLNPGTKYRLSLRLSEEVGFPQMCAWRGTQSSTYNPICSNEVQTNGNWQDYDFAFQTIGSCCSTPINPTTLSTGHSYIQIAWDETENESCFNFSNNNAFNGYEVRYRELGDSWNSIITQNAGATNFYDYYNGGCGCPTILVIFPPQASVYINQLKPCTNYEFQIRTVEIDVNQNLVNATTWSAIYDENTQECSNPYFTETCHGVPKNKACADIEAFSLANQSFPIANGNNNFCGADFEDLGYHYYDNVLFNLNIGESHSFEYYVSAVGQINEFDETINFRTKVWVDLNNDGDFLDANELMTNSTGTTVPNFSTAFTANIEIPNSIVPTTSSMRIAFITESFVNGLEDPGACDNFAMGKVLDFPVLLLQDCTSQAGTMNQNQTSICEGEIFQAAYNPSATVLDNDDALVFVLHTQSGDTLGDILAVNTTAPSFGFDAATMQIGEIYYISAVVGNAMTGFPFVDVTDECLSVSSGTPISFINDPGLGCNLDGCFQITVNYKNSTCPDNLDGAIETIIYGGTPPFSFIWNTGATTSNLTDIPPGDYTVTVTDGSGCAENSMIVLGQYGGEAVSLPDGNGVAYKDTILVSNFASNDVIEQVSDLIAVCVNMEHSWMRDLEIKVTGPNGAEVILHNFAGQTGGQVFLGVPNDNDGNMPTPGTGYNYCWSPFSTNGTWLNYANTNFPSTLPSGDYLPYGSFSNLIGCPINGNWIITIEDLWASDNGYIFDWNIGFAESDNSESITISGEDCLNDLTFILNTTVGQPATAVQIPVTAKNFENVGGFNYTIQLDNPNIGVITGISNAEISPLITPINNTTLIVAWDNPAGTTTGLTLPDDEILFYVDIQLSGEFGTCSDISFVETPLPISAFIWDNNNLETIVPNIVNAQVCIIPEGGDGCDNPIALSCGQTMAANNEFGAAIDSVYSCLDNLLTGKEMYFIFDNPTAQDVKITLSGLTADLELILMDACDNETCLRSSDRAGISNEVIYWEDMPAGEYFIIVEGYLGATSSFLINVECGDLPHEPLVCQGEILPCNGSVQGNNGNGQPNVLQYGCPENPDYESGPEYVYTLTNTTTDTTVVVVTMDGHTADLDLFLLAECDRFACMSASTNSGTETESFITTLLPGETNYVVVDGYNDAISNFTLNVQCFPADEFEDLNCSNAEPIECGAEVNANNDTGVYSGFVYCSGNYDNGSEKIYAFSNAYQQDVSILLTGLSDNLNLYLLDSCTVLNGCVGVGDKSGTSDEGIIIEDLPAGDYIIVVDGHSNAISDFTLSINCIQHEVNKSGKILTENGIPVEDVVVFCNDLNDTLTNVDGAYQFAPVTVGEDYLIEPHKDINYRNGFGLDDIILIRAHALQNQPLDSYYKLIAADVNDDCKINLIDIGLLYQLLLFSIDDFPQVESWRFVPTADALPAPIMPCHVPVFEETIWLPELATDALNQDFVAIKMGDVTENAAGNMLMSNVADDRNLEVLHLEIPAIQANAGDEITIPVYANSSDKLRGFQLELGFDESAISISEVIPNALTGQILVNLSNADIGQMLLAWDHPSSNAIRLEDSTHEPLFSIKATALVDLDGSDNLCFLSENILPSTAFNEDLEPSMIEVTTLTATAATEVSSGENQLMLYKNHPNPFTNQTTISFNIPEAGQVFLKVYDATGKMIFATDQLYGMGQQEIQLSGDLFNQDGVYFCHLTAMGQTRVQSMVYQK